MTKSVLVVAQWTDFAAVPSASNLLPLRQGSPVLARRVSQDNRPAPSGTCPALQFPVPAESASESESEPVDVPESGFDRSSSGS